MKNILDLSEGEIEKIKHTLIEDGLIVEKNKISNYDKEFFKTETMSMVLVKFSLFFSFFLYALINLFGIILSIVYKNFSVISSLIQIFTCLMVLLVCLVVFGNLKPHKKKKENIIFVKDNIFIFNFNNGMVETPNLFYHLPYDNLQRIEFEVYGERKKQVYGRVIFTFKVLDLYIKHTIHSVNITEIKNYIARNFPDLINNIVVDNNCHNPIKISKDSKKGKAYLSAFSCLIASILFFVIPLVFNYYNLALIISGDILFLTAFLVLLSPYLYTYHLIQGLILSCVFMLIGYCIPLFFILNNQQSFFMAIASNNYFLLLTFFGNIGLCLYASSITLIINKILYKIRRRHTI